MKKLIILFLAMTTSVLSAQEKTLLTPDDVARIQNVGQAIISPGGDHVYYTVIVPADPKKENTLPATHLFRYDIASDSHTSLITEYSVANLAFRPGSGNLTFTAKPEGVENTGIYQFPQNSDTPELLMSSPNPISQYAWDPNGKSIALISREQKKEETSNLPYQPEIYEEELQLNHGFITELDGDQLKKLPLEGHITSIHWSPDGGQLAIKSAPSPLVDDFYTSQQITVINTIDNSISGRVDHSGKMGEIGWSPNGKRLAFIAGADKHDPTDGRLFIVNNRGGSPEIQASGMEGAFEHFQWKDNNSLYFLASEGVSSTIGSLNSSGELTRLFTSEKFSVQSFSAANNGSIAMVASTPEHPSELFLLEGMGAAPKRLTNLNPWLENKRLGKQEVVVYKAKDGTEIQGILIQPADQNGPVPMITVVHGGPEAHYDNGWLTAYSMPGQMAAGKGYAVFYPNYRGSTGRGVKFAMSSQGDPGGKEFDDIIDGIDYLVANYGIDKSKVGVTGGSYGGYATAWMSTRHTERFAAGVMFVGISNNLSKWGTSDIPEEMFLVHSRKRIWDDYEFFLKRSPIYYAGQAKTPLLIMHGKDDTRVDPGQSYELYRHIKTRTDTPVRMVLYPGEGHGNRKSTARYDYSLRMMRWFDNYLMNTNEEMPDLEMSTEELQFKN